jgi:hypothetical protein
LDDYFPGVSERHAPALLFPCQMNAVDPTVSCKLKLKQILHENS